MGYPFQGKTCRRLTVPCEGQAGRQREPKISYRALESQRMEMRLKLISHQLAAGRAPSGITSSNNMPGEPGFNRQQRRKPPSRLWLSMRMSSGRKLRKKRSRKFSIRKSLNSTMMTLSLEVWGQEILIVRALVRCTSVNQECIRQTLDWMQRRLKRSKRE